MKKLVILFLLISATSWAQNADKIIQDYYKAIGGEKLQNIHAIIQKSTMQTGGMNFPMETYQNTDGQMYSKIKMMGSDIIAVAFDGKKGFKFDNTTFGYKDIPDSLANVYREQAKNMFGYFYNYKQKGHKVEYLGKEKREGVTYDKIKLIFSKPLQGVKHAIAYFNTETHLMNFIDVEKDGTLVITVTKDFKDFDGIKLPTKIVTKVGGNPVMTINIKEFIINPPKPDPSVFTKPKQ